MTVFVIAALVAVLLVLALLLRPFLRTTASAQTSQRQLNAAIYREQIAKLEQDLAEGSLAQADYAQARTELQRRALDDTSEQDATARLHAPKRTVVALALVLPLVAVGLYLLIGSPAALSSGGGSAHMQNPQDMERLVAGLAKKLESEPDNLKGWAMLARSYKVMGRSQEAEKAFERAGSFIDNDASMLANYADVAAANAGGRLAGKPAQLIAKALQADPSNAMAQWLAGTAALEVRDYARALAIWQRLLTQMEPGSEDARILQGAIEDVRSKSGAVAALPPAAAGAGPRIAAAASPGAPAAATAGASVSGTVELDASMKARAEPGATLMVIARLPGTRMPLAVLRVPASQFPAKFTLDDSLAMNPQALISTAREVELEARISKSGQAKPEPGDLYSAAQTVKVGAKGVALRVGQVRQ